MVENEKKEKNMESNALVSSSLVDDRSKPISPIEEKLLSVLSRGALTRDQLVQKLSIPRTTIYDGLKLLIGKNEVMKYPLYDSARSRGRPVVMFSLLEK